MLPLKTNVLIVGAGPTGLALAIQLRQAGVPFAIVDKLTTGQNTSRAAVIHAHTLEQLERIGVADRLIARGIKVPTFTIRDRDKPLLQIGFEHLPSRFPFLLMLPQDITESILNDRLAELGGTVHRGISATSLEMKKNGVVATLSSGVRDHKIEARYVIGADGMHSVVRKAAEIDFQGAAYEESFVLADVEMDWCLAHKEVSLFFSPQGLVVVAPLPGGSYRIVATLDNAPERPALEDIQALIDQRGPNSARNVVKKVIWGSRFRVHHRLADHYRSGRILLMGDAAHVHSPAGGQGMNAGLVDAIILGQVLAKASRSATPEAVLDSYEKLRRPAAAEVLSLAGRLTQLATMQGTLKRTLRNLALSLINRILPAKRRIMMNLSGLAREHYAEVPGAPLLTTEAAVETSFKAAA